MPAEDRLIAWLRRRLGPPGADLLGDDAAVLPASAPVVTVDQQVAGTHFPEDLPPTVVARRLLAVCLSDLAAMGVEPRHGFLALTMPPGFRPRPFFNALVAACETAGVILAGGDLARGPALAAALTLAGRRWPGRRVLRRCRARAGDAIWIGGTLGESAAGRLLVARGGRPAGRGVRLPRAFSRPASLRRAAAAAVLRHLAPRPQLALGRWLAGRRRAAAIDVSDGLALDLHRLCRASGVGARLAAGRLPLSPGLDRLADGLGARPERLALGGGEDYVLLFTLPGSLRPPDELGARRIGRIVDGTRLTLEADGRRRPLPASGWDHLDRASS